MNARIERVKRRYVRGEIELRELERRIEQILDGNPLTEMSMERTYV